MNVQRHDLLDVAPDAWAEAVEGLDLPGDATRVVAEWSSRRRPVIVRRRLAGDPGNAVPVALQLPNADGRLRVALTVPAGSTTRRNSLVLVDAAVSAPPIWAAPLATLVALGTRFGAPAVYGGLLWQHVTGEPALRPGSDLDLVWRPRAQDRRALIEALSTMDGVPVRIDGEVVLEDGGGVAWRELLAAAKGRTASVAVKTIDGVALRPADAILRETVPC